MARRGAPFAEVVLDGRSVRMEGEPMSGVRTVLLAEDDPALLWIFAEALQAAGLSVVAAADGAAALESAAHSGPIDLLVSDVRMPRMGGFELAQKLRAERTELKVLFISGTEDTTPNGEPLLAKPFRPGDLATAALTLLRAEPARPGAARHDATVSSTPGV
jgi:two-component system cell cycle sensor histidine kinase/response regulator CckA